MRGRQRKPSLSTVISLQGKRTGHEVVQDEIEAQPIGHAAGGRETQAGHDHFTRIHLRKRLLRADFRTRVRGQRIEGIRFLARPVLGETVDAAARGEHEIPHSGVAGALGHRDARRAVDLFSRRFEAVPHGIVGYGGKMHDPVNALQKSLAEARARRRSIAAEA